jgi:IS30 family transposase
MTRKYKPRKYVTPETAAAIWRAWKTGQSRTDIGVDVNHCRGTVGQVVQRRGGVAPSPPRRSRRALSFGEREEISRGLAAAESASTIARRVGRAPSTITRELARHGGRDAYRAVVADVAALQATARPQVCKLAQVPQLARVVAGKLRQKWSPEQIARWLKQTYPAEPTMQVSHETIYQTLYIQARGALKADLTRHLRRRRAMRRSQQASRNRGQGQLIDMVSISARPAGVEDRAVPGHWEGDLLVGTHQSQIATLVERQSRYLLLVRVPARDTATVVRALTRRIQRLPAALKQSLTWDRGKEMAQHRTFTIATDVQVYFCDPHSPWQRGSNENTNGLVRQYFPKGHDLTNVTQQQLDRVARQLNTRPRETLGWRTPAQAFAVAVASTS